MKDNYAAPTLAEVKKAFGAKKIGGIFQVKSRNCQDVQKYIAKLDKIYQETKKSTIQFD